MMNQPYEYVNKLRTACEKMGNCREKSRQAMKRKANAQESMEIPRAVTTTSTAPLNANLKG